MRRQAHVYWRAYTHMQLFLSIFPTFTPNATTFNRIALANNHLLPQYCNYMSCFLDILKRPPIHHQGCLIKQRSTLCIMRDKYVDVQLSTHDFTASNNNNLWFYCRQLAQKV